MITEDKYGGQIALSERICDLPLDCIRGRLVFGPSLSAPTAETSLRVSPHDGKNLNWSFPGDHAGTIAEQVAAYTSDEPFSHDTLLSQRSDGSSLDIIPSALNHLSNDPAQTQCNLDAVLALGAPANVPPNNLSDTRSSVAIAVAVSLTCVSTEIGSRGTVKGTALAPYHADTDRAGPLGPITLRSRPLADQPSSLFPG